MARRKAPAAEQETALVEAPPAENEVRPRGSFVRYTAAEKRAQRSLVESLMIDGWTESMIFVRMRKDGVGSTRTRVVIEQIRERWRTEDENKRPQHRAAAIRRISRNLRAAEGRQNEDGAWVVMPNMQAYVALERLLTDIQGTREPIQVNVNVEYTQAISNVIAELTPDEVERMLEASKERLRLSEAYKAEHPEVSVLAALPAKSTNGVSN